MAGNHYAKVLRKINDAIKDPVESLADQTLATVLLLGIFEVSLVLSAQVIFCLGLTSTAGYWHVASAYRMVFPRRWGMYACEVA